MTTFTIFAAYFVMGSMLYYLVMAIMACNVDDDDDDNDEDNDDD